MLSMRNVSILTVCRRSSEYISLPSLKETAARKVLLRGENVLTSLGGFSLYHCQREGTAVQKHEKQHVPFSPAYFRTESIVRF